ncbi:pantoate--beta-alanine ligase [Sphingomonas sp. NSE70-1]|uniref:Pantothenate synthetase n=1 Tax=Sphingomonas caseinilyticus TaxID=2908205 RepID=A0ABT0RU08_9SPHN|nr:pantoate--beta-alanine ligase [Sphingomonas caseinilyticus]MCL6698507.1 pantoate--beta-alanine ligase [Sphingomonas caseinilyticus]
MQIIRRLSDLPAALVPWRGAGQRIALVPTMGALHAGHLALIDAAKAEADWVVASIFVNPLQFGPTEDLDRYPRQEAEDAELLQGRGCDLLWLPTADQLYPPGFATTVSVSGVSERWDGAARPGHFAGVATVVAKLFTAVRPDLAFFGEKDFQQLAVIRRMEADLGLGINVRGVATVRDADGLALSSRNAYLTPDERSRALALPQSLEHAREAILGGEPVEAALDDAKRNLTEAGFGRIDYFALVDAATLEPLDSPAGEMRLIAAAFMGATRLIDNIRVISATAEN